MASGDLIHRRPVDSRLTVRVKPSADFRLVGDGTTPIVMIGPGSRVAPFRGFLQERHAAGAAGSSWLFFGHRTRAHDFLYEDELRQWLSNGTLTRLDTAFSRDQAEKVYVQHRLWDNRDDVAEWILQGATVYICGERAMGQEVEDTLDRILADWGLDSSILARQGRLRKDTY